MRWISRCNAVALGSLATLWLAALSGIGLFLAPTTLLVVHVAFALVGVLPLTLFLRKHWWMRRASIALHTNAKFGYIALVCLGVVFVSGIGLLIWTNAVVLRRLHLGAMIALLGDLAIHVAWRIRLTIAAKLFCTVGVRSSAGVASASFVCTGITLVSLLQFAQLPSGEVMPILIDHASLGSTHIASAEDCLACHHDLSAQWKASAHGNAATDHYYQALARIFVQEQGVDAARYCAACHGPVGLMQGEVDTKALQRVAAQPNASAYETRRLDVALPMSQRASEGVTCLLCHRVAQAAAQPVNGSLTINAGALPLPTNPIAQMSLRAAPYEHKSALSNAALRQAELCGACHNLRSAAALSSSIALEPTYDEWKASPYAAKGIICQDCHMPPQDGRKADSSLLGQARVHGGWPGAPSSLSGVSDNAVLLQKATQLDIAQIDQLADRLEVTLAITNSGAGHYLPTGADDLRQVWLEVVLSDGNGAMAWQSGKLNKANELDGDDPNLVRFGKVLGDAQGNPIHLHRFWVATQILTDTRLAPLETRDIRYSIPFTALQSASLSSQTGNWQLSARLLYRDVSQSFAEVAFDQPIANLPVREMAQTMKTLALH